MTIHKFFLLLSSVVLLAGCKAKANFETARSDPPSHEIWDHLLQQHVDQWGGVDYKGFLEDRNQLKSYLELLSANPPHREKWSEEEQIAYWINVYNAFTVELILEHYPVESIKDIAGSITFVNTPWDIKFIEIGSEKYDLNNVEHGILRKYFSEPLIHVAVNCASVSCPRLRNEAFTGDRLQAQLEDQAQFFINQSGKNKVSKDHVQLSRLLKWYGGDFEERYGSVLGFVQAFSDVSINEEAEVDFLEYDWNLNTPEAMKL